MAGTGSCTKGWDACSPQSAETKRQAQLRARKDVKKQSKQQASPASPSTSQSKRKQPAETSMPQQAANVLLGASTHEQFGPHALYVYGMRNCAYAAEFVAPRGALST